MFCLYDGAGNRTLESANGALTSFTWNEENKLVGVSLPSGETQSLVYSGEGDLRRRTVALNGVTQSDVRLLKDGLVVLQEQDAITGTLLRRYTNGGDEWGNLLSLAQSDAGIFNQSLFNVARFNQTRASRFLVSDQLGSTRLLLNGAGAITDTFLASGFGVELAASGSSPNLFWFGGNWQYLRLMANLLLAGARVYDAKTGTWMSLDPLGFWGGDANLFRYVGNNPINEVDPAGLYVPLVGGYGNCCGFRNQCNQFSRPIDCVDTCCQYHDICLSTIWEFCNPSRRDTCQRQLSLCVINCQLRGCRSMRPYVASRVRNCLEAATSLYFYSATP